MIDGSLADDVLREDRRFKVEIVEPTRWRYGVYRLRYQVYCVERGFEDGQNGEETDEYDAHSRHALLRDYDNGKVVGTIRVIGPSSRSMRGSFPMQRLVDASLLYDIPLHKAGELSRMAISQHNRIKGPEAAILRMDLWRAVVQMSGEMGLSHWLAVVERSSIRLHARSGIAFEPLGPMISHHGYVNLWWNES